MKVKVLKPIGLYSPGSTVEIQCDKSGVPLDLLWRRRLADAEFDKCCEIVKKSRKPLKSKESKE